MKCNKRVIIIVVVMHSNGSNLIPELIVDITEDDMNTFIIGEALFLKSS